MGADLGTHLRILGAVRHIRDESHNVALRALDDLDTDPPNPHNIMARHV